MSYVITKSDGTTLVTIADGSVDTTTSLNLPGPNYTGYGQRLNENLVYLLENFAANTAPGGTNLQGQLWFDKYHQRLNVFTSAGYQPVSGIINASVQPTNNKDGDVWYNTATEQAFIYDNGAFKLIGPVYSKQYGAATAIPVTLNDATVIGLTHDVLQLQVDNVILAFFSKDKFYPSPAITGFDVINSGLTLNSNYTPTTNGNINGYLNGTAIGTHYGDSYGNLFGNVTGTLTGNFNGTATGSLTGSFTGTVNASTAVVNNLTANSISVLAGSLSGISTLSAAAISVTGLTNDTGYITNFSSPNVQITSGNLTGIYRSTVTTESATNFSSPNVLITGGNISGIASLSATTGTFTNLTTGTITVSGGALSGLSSLSATTAAFTNLSTGNLQVTGGATTGLTTASGTTASFTNITTPNLVATSGNVSNFVGTNVTITNSNITNATATTANISTNNTQVATTAFIHSMFPKGMIMMWNSTAASIPYGWQLCNGTNGTPDLRGQFIVGAGGSYSFGDTGGYSSVTLSIDNVPSHSHYANTVSLTIANSSAHTHTTSVTDPGHTHGYRKMDPYNHGATDLSTPYGGRVFGYYDGQPTDSATTGISVGVNAGGVHNHVISISGNVATIGGSQPHENRPPYYALCYIQKMTG